MIYRTPTASVAHVTMFTIPKAFRGHIGVIQRNALDSWTRQDGVCEVIMFGAEDGVREEAERIGAIHQPHVQCTPEGTPLLDGVFRHASYVATSAWLCYVNADIILLPSLVATLKRIPFREFLAVGRRLDLRIERRIQFGHPSWATELAAQAINEGNLHNPSAIDYLVFPRTAAPSLPPFAVGRAGWDNWMIYSFRKRGIPVVDLTESVMAIHQNHDYHHVPHGRGQGFNGPESDRNRVLVPEEALHYKIANATHRLARGILKRQSSRARLYVAAHRMENALQVRFPRLRRVVKRLRTSIIESRREDIRQCQSAAEMLQSTTVCQHANT